MKLKDLNLDKLKTIHFLSETKSVSKTAQQLFITPSAVCQSLSALEKQLGIQLFLKRGKTLLPTVYCEKLLHMYAPFHYNLENFLLSESSSQKQIKGELRVFMPGLAGSKILSKPFADFLKKNQGVNLTLESGSSENALKGLHNNTYDFAICGIKQLIAQHKWCTFTPLFELTMGLYCSKEFYKQNKAAIQANDFSNLPFISGYQNQKMLKWYFHEIGHLKTDVPTRVNIYDMNFMTKAVIHGLGIGLLAKELVQDELHKNELISIHPKALKHPIFLVHQKQKSLSLVEQTFYDFIIAWSNKSETRQF